MTSLRKILVACVASVALFAPVTATSVASANEPRHHHEHVYYVYYRTCPQSQWVCYGGYYRVDQARQAVRYFEYQGYDSYYR
jgi:hypothetical protein